MNNKNISLFPADFFTNPANDKQVQYSANKSNTTEKSPIRRVQAKEAKFDVIIEENVEESKV
jgi:hypothetical protein